MESAEVKDVEEQPIRPPFIGMQRVMNIMTALAIPFWTLMMLSQYQFTLLRLSMFLLSIAWAPFLTFLAMAHSAAYNKAMLAYIFIAEKMDRATKLK